MSSILEALRKLEADKAAKSAAEEGVRVFEPQSARMELLTDAPEEKPRTIRRFPVKWVAAGVAGAAVLTILSSVVSIAVMRSMASSAPAAVPSPADAPKVEVPKLSGSIAADPEAPAIPAKPVQEEKAQVAGVPETAKAPVSAETLPVESEAKPAAATEKPSAGRKKPEKEPDPIAKPEVQPEAVAEPKTPDPVLLPPLPAKAKEEVKPAGNPKPEPRTQTESAETGSLQVARASETPSAPGLGSRRESPRFSANKPPGGHTPMADPGKTEAKVAQGPVNLDTLPVLRGGELARYGLENMHINVLREAGPDRPYAVAIINLANVYVGDLVPGTQVKLIGVRRDGIGVQVPGTDERFFVQQ